MIVRRLISLGLLAALALMAGPPAVAQTPLTELTFGILTPTASEWPVYIAQAQGFYKDEGLNVTIVEGNTPPNVINMVATNGANLVDNGCDSEIAAVTHQLPLKMIAPMFGVNPYSLVVLPSIKSWADLKGKSVMLGTKQDVTAIALGALAAAHKLTLDDFQIVIGGNSTARYAGLASGNVQGSMLGQPFDLLAESKGDVILGTASDVIKDWAFTCVAANNDWASKNRPTVLKFLRALRKAIQYGYANKAGSVAVLVDKTKVDPAIAARAWDLDFGKWKAFNPTLKLSIPAVQSVGKYQVQFGVIPAMPPMSDLYDPSFVADAFK
ncbi:MAG TPA: ABC transporter substrate-binding protein [Candidatus Lustribacter sp.]|jgi:NitT/TauT family transport system substrate-binding protein|nr:ABC transporter substrate-binding protein [Candidatus Lustribacter sp.]